MDPVPLTERFTEAFNHAATHYGGRIRGNTNNPAIAHAMAVAALVLNIGGGEDEAIAALLHDVPEDAEDGTGAQHEIEQRFGPVVAELVLHCTDELEPSGRPWTEVKAEYVERLASVPVAALRISLADKADNTRALLRRYSNRGDALFIEHQSGSRAAVLAYYEALVRAFKARSAELGPRARPLLAELERVVEVLRSQSGG